MFEMIVREIKAKSILSKSQVYDYALNAYIGCSHKCLYCYARFMKRYTGHDEAWGDFVDVKTNACELLATEVRKKRIGRVWISGVCDAYQPLERKYQLTRGCIKILVENDWPFTIQTKSPLVLRDIELMMQATGCEVGITITTADEDVRKIFEPYAPPIVKRIEALSILHSRGIRTFAMIAPPLPGAEGLIEVLKGIVDHVLVDKLNYHYADWAFKKHGMRWAMDDEFFQKMGKNLKAGFQNAGVSYRQLF